MTDQGDRIRRETNRGQARGADAVFSAAQAQAETGPGNEGYWPSRGPRSQRVVLPALMAGLVGALIVGLVAFNRGRSAEEPVALSSDGGSPSPLALVPGDTPDYLRLESTVNGNPLVDASAGAIGHVQIRETAAGDSVLWFEAAKPPTGSMFAHPVLDETPRAEVNGCAARVSRHPGEEALLVVAWRDSAGHARLVASRDRTHEELIFMASQDDAELTNLGWSTLYDGVDPSHFFSDSFAFRAELFGSAPNASYVRSSIFHAELAGFAGLRWMRKNRSGTTFDLVPSKGGEMLVITVHGGGGILTVVPLPENHATAVLETSGIPEDEVILLAGSLRPIEPSDVLHPSDGHGETSMVDQPTAGFKGWSCDD